MQHRALS